MVESERWVARVRPTETIGIDALLHLPLGLDVWERGESELIVAASDAQLRDLERRQLAKVERLSTIEEYTAEAQAEGVQGRTHPGGGHGANREGDVPE